MSLAKRNALVTGSTSGIGLAIARALAKEGANVVINGMGEAAAIETERGDHREGIFRQGVLQRRRHDEARRNRGDDRRCAGASWVRSTFSSTTPASSSFRRSRISRPEKWDAIIAINLSAAFHAIRAATFPAMKAQKWGRIISTASAHSLVASPFKSAYVAAKHGIDGLTKTVALELATVRRHRQLHFARLCLDAAGRKSDPRHDEGARPDPRAGDQRRDPRRAADQAIRHLRSGRRARRLSVLGRGRADHRRQSIRSTAAGPRRSAALSARQIAPPRQGLVKPGCENDGTTGLAFAGPSWALPGVSLQRPHSRRPSQRRRGARSAGLAAGAFAWLRLMASRRGSRRAGHPTRAADQPRRILAVDRQRARSWRARTPYRDVVELNPPASILLYRLPALIGRLLGARPEWVVAAMVALLVAGALAYARNFIPRYRLSGSADDAIFLIVAALVLAVLPFDELAQRDHVATLLMLPFALVGIARLAGRQVGPADALLAGVTLGLAVAIKPHFGLCALLLSAVLRRGACATSGRRFGSNTGRPARSCWPISPARRCSFRCSFPTCCPSSPTSICRCGSICRRWSGELRRWSRCRSRSAGSAAIAGATPRYRSCCWSAPGSSAPISRKARAGATTPIPPRRFF